MNGRTIVTLMLALVAAAAASAQPPPRVRGVIESFQGQTLVVATPNAGSVP